MPELNELNLSEDVRRLNPELAGDKPHKPVAKILFAESEEDFTTWVIAYARLKGWRVAHFRPSRTIKDGKETWRTAVSADGAGFPDFVFARRGQAVIAELKSETGKVSAAQQEW